MGDRSPHVLFRHQVTETLSHPSSVANRSCGEDSSINTAASSVRGGLCRPGMLRRVG
jgi:hypothetical protein